MAELMIEADLAIGAGGVMSWERCCLGLPAIAVDIASNQIGTLTALDGAGALIYLGSARSTGEAQIAASIRAMAEDPARVKSMGTIALALVDGEGAGRVRSAMSELPPPGGPPI